MSETLHHLEVTIRYGAIDHRFTCSGDGRSRCHLICSEGCDSWTFGGHEHELVDGGECNLVAFVANDEAELYELYDGDPEPFRSGAIELSYQDEYVTWSYA